MIEFEFDKQKSQSNKKKHGIDFIEAQAIWKDESRLELPAKTEDEPRFLTTGMIAGKMWSAVTTIREEKIRIISVRRARQEEVDLYEGKGL